MRRARKIDVDNIACDSFNITHLSMFSLNIQCLGNKTDLLSLFLEINNYDLVLLNEHWQSELELSLISLSGYILEASFCREARRHGGVAVYCRPGLRCVAINTASFSRLVHAEFAAVEITDFNCAVVSVYRSSANGLFSIFLECLEDLLNYLSRRYARLFVIGDFNCDHEKQPGNAILLNCLMSSFGLRATVFGKTRITHSSASSLDNAFTNLELDRVKTEIIDPAISDHMGLDLRVHLDRRMIELPARVARIIKIVTFAGLQRLRTALESVEWSTFNFAHLGGDAAMSLFLQTLSYYMTECRVLRHLKENNSRKRCPVVWFTSELRDMRDTLHALKTVFNVTRSHEDWSVYRSHRALYKRRLVESKKSAYGSFVGTSSNRQKSIWKLINHERSADGKQTNTYFYSAEEFNTFFVNIAKEIIENLPNCDLGVDEMLSRIPRNIKSFFSHQ